MMIIKKSAKYARRARLVSWSTVGERKGIKAILCVRVCTKWCFVGPFVSYIQIHSSSLWSRIKAMKSKWNEQTNKKKKQTNTMLFLGTLASIALIYTTEMSLVLLFGQMTVEILANYALNVLSLPCIQCVANKSMQLSTWSFQITHSLVFCSFKVNGSRNRWDVLRKFAAQIEKCALWRFFLSSSSPSNHLKIVWWYFSHGCPIILTYNNRLIHANYAIS